MPDDVPADAPRGDERQLRKRDLAARAAWLYFIAGNTQDELASKLNVSRQAAQRLVAAAVAEGLITFRIDHPIRACVELEEALRARFALDYVEVVPGDADRDGVTGLGGAAARQLEAHLAPKAPTVLAFSTGRTLRATVAQVAPMERPQHTLVSLIGTMTRDGRASPYEIVMRLADRVGAISYPLPTPVVTDTAEERELLQSQRSYRVVQALVDQAKVVFVGVGTIDAAAPLLIDGFITGEELEVLTRAGAIGEVAGSAFDAEGRLVESAVSVRSTAVPIELPVRRLTIGIAGGRAKAAAIAGALRGRLLTGLITDEAAARRILELHTDQP